MAGKAVRRGLLTLGLGFVMTPVTLGLSVVLLVTTFDEDEGGDFGNLVGGLRIGKN